MWEDQVVNVAGAPTDKIGRVADINPGSGDSDPMFITPFSGGAIFSANDGTHGAGIWVYNGTTLTQISAVGIGVGAINAEDFTVVGNYVYFVAFNSYTSRELWKTDGTVAGTKLVDEHLSRDGLRGLQQLRPQRPDRL